MIIEKIDIKSFGKLRDITLEFSDTVNVIEGENEAGKSTIASFIKYMLFGFEGTDGEAVSERQKRINWTTGLAEGSMTVRVKDKRYLITRSTVPTTGQTGKTAYKEDCAIIDMETGATAFGKLPAGEVFFGASRELFENTAFLGRVGDSSIDEDSVKGAIENILFSGSEKINNQRAIGKISEKMETLIHKGGGGGVIFDLVKRRDELEARMVGTDEDNKQILVKETELFGIKRERLDAEDKLNKLYDLDSCYKNVMLIETFDKLHELEVECASAVSAYNNFVEENTKNGYAPADEYLSELVMARRTLEEAGRTLVDAEATLERECSAVGITREIEGNIELADSLGGEDKILDDAKAARTGIVKNGVFAGLGALAGAALAVCQIFAKGALAHIASRIGLGALGISALALGGYCLYLLLRNKKKLGALAGTFFEESYADLEGKIGVIREARAKRDGIIRATESARARLEGAKLAYDNAKSELIRVVARWGEEPPATEQGAFLDRLEARVSAYLERKKILFEEKNTIELTVKEIRRTLSDKNEIDIRAQVSPLKRKALSRVNHDEIITGIAAYRAKITEQDKLAFAVESELMLLKSRSSDPSELYSKVAALDSKVRELKEKHKAYFVAVKAIESASDNLRSGISPRLGEYSTELMGVMTDKKYSSFDISSGLKVSYLAENGEQKSVDFLSGGTRDLAYIAVRMALIDMLFTEHPPVCFDESFAHQDNLRARSMMKAISELSERGYQSFIFTCRARETVLADELVQGAGIFKLS